MSDEDFDFAAFKWKAIIGLYAGQWLDNKDGVLAPLIKELLEASLEGELAAHLAQEQASSESSAASKNRRNGETLNFSRPGKPTDNRYMSRSMAVSEMNA